MEAGSRSYVAIDLKSFYASVECRERGLNPLMTNLVVADAARTEKTICLAVSPPLKALGISGRPLLPCHNGGVFFIQINVGIQCVHCTPTFSIKPIFSMKTTAKCPICQQLYSEGHYFRSLRKFFRKERSFYKAKVKDPNFQNQVREKSLATKAQAEATRTLPLLIKMKSLNIL